MFGVDEIMNKKYVLKNKTKFFSFIFIISLIAFMTIYTNSVSGYKEAQYQSVAIQSGDTLWSIAEKYGNNSDIRKYIYEIKKINNLDSNMLYENTAILIPVED
jgi:cell division protein YceG involved in septum cleavage